MSAEIHSLPKRFPSTHWSVILRTKTGGEEAGRKALTDLLVRYRAPLISHLIRKRRLSQDRAEDVLQGFIADRILEKHLIARADKTRGKFRTYLLTALDNYLIDLVRQERARKPPDGSIFSVEDEHTLMPEDAAVSDVFDVAWAQEVLARTLRLMHEHCREFRRSDVWAVFEARSLRKVVREYVENSDEVEAEIAELHEILSQARAE